MIYPNWLYYPDDDLELFIDTVQQVSYVTGCSTTEYVSAEDGKLKTKTTKQLPQATFECTWDTNHTRDLYRYLKYLLGKEVILAFGPLDLASYAKIVEASVPKTVGTVQKATLSVQFLGDVRGQFREAEDSRNTDIPATISDSDASGGIAVYMWELGYFYFQLTQSDIILPAGNYRFFARVKDSAQVTNNFDLIIYNQTDVLVLANELYTLTSSFRIYTLDFTVSDSDVGDNIQFRVKKYNSATSDIYVDFLGFVAVP